MKDKNKQAEQAEEAEQAAQVETAEKGGKQAEDAQADEKPEQAEAAQPETSEPDKQAEPEAEPDKQAEQADAGKGGKSEPDKQADDGELVRVKRENAILKAQREFPVLTDEMFEFCAESDPAKVAEWAKRAVSVFGLSGEAEKTPREPYSDKQHQIERLARTDNSAGDPSMRVDAMRRAHEKAMAKQQERAKALHTNN